MESVVTIVTHRSCFSGLIEMGRVWACLYLPACPPLERGRGMGSLAGTLLNLFY